MSRKLKALRPFTDHVPGRGMVVFNVGTEDTLPDEFAARRTAGTEPFAEYVDDESTAEPDRLQELLRSGPEAPASTEPGPVKAAKTPKAAKPAAPPKPAKRRGRGRPPKAAAARSAGPTDAPAD